MSRTCFKKAFELKKNVEHSHTERDFWKILRFKDKLECFLDQDLCLLRFGHNFTKNEDGDNAHKDGE